MLRSRVLPLLTKTSVCRGLFGPNAVQCWHRRGVATAEEQPSRGADTIQPGQRSIIPFQLGPSAALAAFIDYQKACCFQLHAGDLLSSAYKLEPAFLPFYLFEAVITTEAIATLGRRADKSKRSSPLVWTKLDEWKQIGSHLHLPRTESYMQVYASYRLRRDLAEAAKPLPEVLESAKSLSPEQLKQQSYHDAVAGRAEQTAPAATQSSSSSGPHNSGAGGNSNETDSSSADRQQQQQHVRLDEPEMRQAIAWQLCHRQIMHSQIEAAVQHFKQQSGADEVRDLQVRLHVHSRTARIAYLPAYHLHYVHGEKYTPSRADIVPAEYDAVISGASGRVCAELHPSPTKSQAAAAAAVGGVGLGVMPLSALALGLDPSISSIAGADAAFLAVLAGTAAGALASRLPLIARNLHAAEQAEAERKFYRQYDQHETAHGAPPDEHTLWLWKDADWRKWEQDDRWAWSGPQRKKWAEQLFREQAQRDIDRVAVKKQQEQQSQQRQEDEERELKREKRFGRSRRFAHHHAGGVHEESGARMSHQQYGQHRRRRDFLGYYKALGINLEDAGTTITADYIKTHYKAAALKLHPDKHVHSDEATQKRTAEKFRRLQLAYETLRDNEKRRAYDRGQLVQ